MSPAADPSQDVDTLYEAARAATAARDHRRAIALCEQALALQPAHPGLLALLGFWRLQQEKWSEAIGLFHAAREAGGESAELLNHLATAYYRSGDLRLAANALTTALKRDAEHLDTHLNLASLLLEARQLGPARKHAERALALGPHRYECVLGMGLLCQVERHLGDALRWLAQAESIVSERTEAPMAEGVLYQEIGMPGEAIAAFERALRRRPQHPELHSNRLFTMSYLPELDAAGWLAEHRRFERVIRLPRRGPSPPARRREDQRCRIGYVSADLREHAVARFLLPVLRRHDHARFHVTGYYSGRVVDDTTREISRLCDVYRPVATLNDQQLLDQIADDDIDVLIDLSGHSAGNRLPVFAAGAAPVQVSWLGYLGSTGLSSMHYRLTDAIADPAGVSEAWHTERLVRLPRSMWTCEPYPAAPAVTSSPLARNGYLTFGALNNPAKTSAAALRSWAAILQRVPASRLKLIAYDDSAMRDRLLLPFVHAGVAAERITLLGRVPPMDYLRTYGDIDIAFDSFPYNGATTVCDALWQGVPVLAVQSARPFGGSAATILHQVGLDDWVAESAEALVAMALRKIEPESTTELANLRQTMRQRMQESALLDAAGLTRELEKALRALQVSGPPAPPSVIAA